MKFAQVNLEVLNHLGTALGLRGTAVWPEGINVEDTKVGFI